MAGSTTLEEFKLIRVFNLMVEALEGVVGGLSYQKYCEALEEFLKFQPPVFFGWPIQEREADLWMDQMVVIYKILRYPNIRKIEFAAFRLRGPARN